MNKCTGIMGRIFGHKFMPMITKGAAPALDVIGDNQFVLNVMEKARDQHFHGCICQRCGAVTGEKK